MAYFTFTDKDNFKDGDGNETKGNKGTLMNGLAKIGWDINQANRVQLTFDQYKDQGDYYVKTNFGGGWNVGRDVEDIEYTRTSYSLQHTLDLHDNIKLRTSVYQNELSYKRNDYASEGKSTHTVLSLWVNQRSSSSI